MYAKRKASQRLLVVGIALWFCTPAEAMGPVHGELTCVPLLLSSGDEAALFLGPGGDLTVYDIAPCGGNNTVDVDDISAILDAFAGIYGCNCGGGTAWNLTGNAGTNDAADFVGTTDNVSLNFRVNNQRVMRLEPNATSPNVIGGFAGNSETAGVKGATIGGGGEGGFDNLVTDDYGTIGGGRGNRAGDAAGTFNDRDYATVGGGDRNTASGLHSTIGGGFLNTAGGQDSAVGGGNDNTAGGFVSTVGGGSTNDAAGHSSTVGGGTFNTAGALNSTVSGGESNKASGSFSAIPGGFANEAGGDHSFAGGRRAKARNDDSMSPYYSGDFNGDEGTFLWADSTNADFVSTGPNQFLVRASGGMYFGTNSTVDIPAGRFINTSTDAHLTTGGMWTNSSDRNAKENFRPIDPASVLRKAVSIPISRWNYRSESDRIEHIGPMAQDFHAAFGTGDSDKTIGTVDADGVALASIQGLHKLVEQANQRISEKDCEIEELKALVEEKSRSVDGLEDRIARLEALVRPVTPEAK